MSKNFFKVIVPSWFVIFWGQLENRKEDEANILELWRRCYSEYKSNKYFEHCLRWFTESLKEPTKFCKEEALFNCIGLCESAYWNFKAFVLWVCDNCENEKDFFKCENLHWKTIFEGTAYILGTVMHEGRDCMGYTIYAEEKKLN